MQWAQDWAGLCGLGKPSAPPEFPCTLLTRGEVEETDMLSPCQCLYLWTQSHRGPLGPQDVQADAAIAADIRVIDFGSESKPLGVWKDNLNGVDGQGKKTLPCKDCPYCGTLSKTIPLRTRQFLLDPIQSHVPTAQAKPGLSETVAEPQLCGFFAKLSHLRRGVPPHHIGPWASLRGSS